MIKNVFSQPPSAAGGCADWITAPTTLATYVLLYHPKRMQQNEKKEYCKSPFLRKQASLKFLAPF